MIEIEKKFLLSDAQEQTLLTNANELGEKTVKDSYFDTSDYSLTLQDFWFRKRDGAYELKLPLESGSGSYTATNRYHELTDLETICHTLGLANDSDFETTLALHGIAEFITIFTNRRSYEKEGFHIDIDAATYADSDFRYALAEIELLVNEESEADDAEHRIIAFAERFGLATDQVILGKVAAYLQQEKPDHYQALVAAGVLK